MLIPYVLLSYDNSCFHAKKNTNPTGSNIITNDVYRVLYPKASADTLLYVGRVSTVVFALLSFAWIPVFLSSETGLFRTISEIQGLLTPPIGIVLLLGVSNRRVNGPGALCGLVVGTFMGALRLIVVVVLKGGSGYDASTAVGSTLNLFFGMAFLHFSILLW
jgi:Na+/proline symporter